MSVLEGKLLVNLPVISMVFLLEKADHRVRAGFSLLCFTLNPLLKKIQASKSQYLCIKSTASLLEFIITVIKIKTLSSTVLIPCIIQTYLGDVICPMKK